MDKTSAIHIFCLAISVTVATSDSEDPFLEGYIQTCATAYRLGCEIGNQTTKGVYDGATGELGAEIGYTGGFTAGFACGLCESYLFCNGNTSQGNETGTQCGNQDGDREAECCKNNGPQCGNNAFQQGYNVGYSVGCATGYQVGKGKFAQGSLISVGAYAAAIVCGTEGIQNCSMGNLGGGTVGNNLNLVAVP